MGKDVNTVLDRIFGTESHMFIADHAECRPCQECPRHYVLATREHFILEGFELECIPDAVLFAEVREEGDQVEYARLIFTGNRASLGTAKLLIQPHRTFSITFDKDVEGRVFAIGNSARKLGGA
jgi:hypothetical protein